jgi:hypothetical protein
MPDYGEKYEAKFEKALSQAAGGNPVFPYLAKQQMGKMVEEILASEKIIGPSGTILGTDHSFSQKGGWMAEEYHAHSFNMDAILNESDSRAFTDKREGWGQHEINGQKLRQNANQDLIIVKDRKVVHKSQVKYLKNADDTAGAMSEVKDGKIKYESNDSLIGPSDQILGIKTRSNDNLEKNLERNGDPVRREAYRQTHDKATATLTDGESSSSPLTKDDADTMGKGDTGKFDELNNDYQTSSTIRQSARAVKGAAAMAAIVSGTVNTISCLRRVQNGELTLDEAALTIVKETVCSAADSAIKAGSNAAVQSLMVRYGAEKAVIGTLARQGVKSMLRTNAVTVGVVCAIDAVKDLIRLSTGDISKDEFFARQGKNILNTSAGVLGGSLGAAAASSVVVATGLAGSAVGTLLLTLGGLSGGLIAGLAMNMASENGIEKPYQDLVKNTAYMYEAAQELERLSQAVFISQVLFTKFIEENVRLDQRLKDQMCIIDQAGIEAFNSIMKI